MKRSMVIATGLVLAGQSALWILWRRRNPLISEENGPMEAAQALMILIGAAVLAWTAQRGVTIGERIFRWSLALFYGTFVFSEIDTRPLGSPIMELVLDGAIRNVLLAVLWAAALMAFLRHRVATWQVFRGWIGTSAGVLLMAAGVLWMLSATIDKLKLFRGTHHFYEELPETSAAILMLLAAVVTARLPQRSLPDNGVGARDPEERGPGDESS
jgi:hypothetical protein